MYVLGHNSVKGGKLLGFDLKCTDLYYIAQYYSMTCLLALVVIEIQSGNESK